MLNKLLIGSSALGLALLQGPAVAQKNAAASTGNVLEEVVVTAERREASLQTVPIPVTAITREAIENHQVTEAKDLQRFAPSLRMSNIITSPTNLSPSLRGSLQQDASLVVAESPFGIYVDDVYIGRLNGNNVTLADIDRVEVLRGPQGTLYGRNTLSGAIKFMTRVPGKNSDWLTAKVGVGNWNQYVASVSAGGMLSDTWAGSFAAQINNKDRQYKNLATSKEQGQEQNVAARFKLHYVGGEHFDALISAAYSDSKNDANQLLPGTSPGVPVNSRYTSDDVILRYGSNTLSSANVVHSPAIIGALPKGTTRQTILSANLSYKFDSFTLRSITAYVNTDDFFSTDFGGDGQVLGASNPMADQYTQELQIQGTGIGDRLNYLAGVYYLNEKGAQDFGWNITRSFFNVGPVSTSQMKAQTQSVSAFGQFDYKITDALKATAGVRWVSDTKTFHERWQPLFFPGSVPPVDLKNKYTVVTPKFGLDYTVNTQAVDSMLLYLSAARGFKSGGYNGINITDNKIADSPYGPESNWTYELGIKTDLLDRKLRINADAFVAKIKDLALNATVINPITGVASFPVQNAGDATVKGLEIETTFLPTENLSLFLNASFLHGKYDRLNSTSAPAVASLPQQAPFVNNNRLGVKAEPPQLPKYTYTVGFDYSRNTQIAGRDGRFKFGADWYRTADYITAATNDFVVTAYNRFNGYVGADVGDNWDVRLTARNLNNDHKVYVGSRGFLGGYLVLPPREIMFSVTYKK